MSGRCVTVTITLYTCTVVKYMYIYTCTVNFLIKGLRCPFVERLSSSQRFKIEVALYLGAYIRDIVLISQ